MVLGTANGLNILNVEVKGAFTEIEVVVASGSGIAMVQHAHGMYRIWMNINNFSEGEMPDYIRKNADQQDVVELLKGKLI